jgi:putative addiction module component (TIGR02574 family)
MAESITQTDLSNKCGEIMRRLDQGESFVVTRNGTPVGELTPLRRHRFVNAVAAVAIFKNARPLSRIASVPTLFRGQTRKSTPVPERRYARGTLDTSVVIDLEHIEPDRLPVEIGISAITMAELTAGPHATADPGSSAVGSPPADREPGEPDSSVSIRGVPWHTSPMALPAIDFDELSTEERLGLIERLWESLSHQAEAVPLTGAQRQDLDDRLDELERNGPDGLTWDEVVKEARRGA